MPNKKPSEYNSRRTAKAGIDASSFDAEDPVKLKAIIVSLSSQVQRLTDELSYTQQYLNVPSQNRSRG